MKLTSKLKYLEYFKVFESELIHCKCGWEWRLSEGGNDPYTCHKCGGSGKKEEISDEKMEWSKHFEIISFRYSFFDMIIESLKKVI